MNASQIQVSPSPAVVNPDGSIEIGLKIKVLGLAADKAQKVVGLENDIAAEVQAVVSNQGVFVEVLGAAKIVQDVTGLK